MTRKTLAAVGTLASVAALASAQRTVQPFNGDRIDIEPLLIAPAVCGPDGPRMVGDWMPYEGSGTTTADAEMIFDSINCTGDCPDNCPLFFGTGYCNMFWTNDMTVVQDTVIGEGASRFDFIWYWTAGGSGSSEHCIVAVFTQESVPCEPDSRDYEGWLLDYGTLASGGPYFSSVDLGPGAWPLPSTGTGSYYMYYLRQITSSGAWVLATCAQPMLWATGDDRGDPDAPGTSGPNQFEDDSIVDGSHSSSECYSYSYTNSVCPNQPGGAAGIWGIRAGDDCLASFPNCDGNDEVNTQDFLCFLGKWSNAFQSGNYDAGADCNADGRIDALDFLCFLRKFRACFG